MALPSKLSKLKMPVKRDPKTEAREEMMHQDMDNDMEEGEPSDHQDMVLGDEDEKEPGMGDESGDMGDEDGSLEPDSEEQSEHETTGHDLQEVSDDDLIAELKKRGLAEDMDGSEQSDSSEAPMDMPAPKSTNKYK